LQVGFSLDPRLQLDPGDELALVKRGAELGYESAWTPAGPDAAAFDRCHGWYEAAGLPVGIAVVPAADQPPAFYAEHARRVHEGSDGNFIFGVGSGAMEDAARGMRAYLGELRALLPVGPPLYLAALGPLMLRLAGEQADGVSLNWCSAEMVAWSRRRVEAAAREAGRDTPVIAMYIRTCVDPDPDLARATLGQAALMYALGPPAYRKHFERMGFAEELAAIERTAAAPSAEFLSASGAAGAPGEVRAQFDRIASGGLDVAIVRVLSPRPGDPESVLRALEECAPNRG
jgi:alkanesulfonate monooxygenase SsuD/methylene tetrahydromethanopterin reductase-like flavin-dependent oxidoreductase (luciferase family)